MADDPMTDAPLTPDEADTFAAKLGDFGQTLNDRERTVLNTLLLPAVAGAEQVEVAGFSFGDLTTTSLVDASRPSAGEMTLGDISTVQLGQAALNPVVGRSLGRPPGNVM